MLEHAQHISQMLDLPGMTHTIITHCLDAKVHVQIVDSLLGKIRNINILAVQIDSNAALALDVHMCNQKTNVEE